MALSEPFPQSFESGPDFTEQLALIEGLVTCRYDSQEQINPIDERLALREELSKAQQLLVFANAWYTNCIARLIDNQLKLKNTNPDTSALAFPLVPDETQMSTPSIRLVQ